jgi:hypothetical protein
MQEERKTSARELVGSFMSFAWAMSLFSANQIANLLNPKKAETSFNAVAEATREQVGEVFRPVFQVGETLQRGAIDLMFRMLSLGMLDPRRIVKSSAEVMQRSASGLSQWVPAETPKARSQHEGWGPVD